MQSKIIDVNILRETFSRNYKMNSKMIHFNEQDFIDRNPITFLLTETFIGSEKLEDEVHDFDTFKNEAINLVKDRLMTLIDGVNNEIDIILEDKILKIKNLFVKNKDLSTLREKHSKLQSLLNNPVEIESMIKFQFNNYEDICNIPFYKLERNQKLFLVIQDPVSYMKIEQAHVKDIFISEGENYNGNKSFFFDYDISFTGIHQRISGSQISKFDGSKCIINYNFAIFTNLEDAKQHCLKVLNAIKKTVDDKIKNVENFEEF